MNERAVTVVQRVQDKLAGRDFSFSWGQQKDTFWHGIKKNSNFGETTVTVEKQVDLLIEQATSKENLCQCYRGWCVDLFIPSFFSIKRLPNRCPFW